MPQGFLNDLEIGAIGSQPGGEAVPQHVRVDVRAEDQLQYLLDQVLDPPLADR